MHEHHSAVEKSASFLEWRFHQGCFDLGKLQESHSSHKEREDKEQYSNLFARSIDIPCVQCQQLFTAEPWTFLNDNARGDYKFHAENDFKAYMLIRFDKRVQFVDKLEGVESKRAEEVKRKCEELVRCRDLFAQYGPKQRLLLSLDGWKEKWASGDPGPVQRVAVHTWWNALASRRPRQTTTSTGFSNLAMSSRACDNPVTRPTDSTSQGRQGFNSHYNVGVMYFERKDNDGPFLGVKQPMVASPRPEQDKFPDQRMPIDDILSADPQKLSRNPLAQACPDNTLRYFHLPANNMIWVEEAMARYYSEIRRAYSDKRALKDMRKHEKLLRREFWRGQVHGGIKCPVHARHMRPRVSVIPRPNGSSAKDGSRGPAKDVALFLPYLHWEHHALQKRIQREIDDANEEKKMSRHGHLEKKSRRFARRKTRVAPFEHLEDNTTSGADTPLANQEPRGSMRDIIVEVAADRFREGTAPGISDESDAASDRNRAMEKKPRRKYRSRKSVLANLLWTVAQIAVEMRFVEEYSPDTKMLREFVHKDPPLHIRRTLDQFYFHTLEDTRARDCDQVVHRGTRVAKEGSPRIIMVDQLWLWILDDNTIITAFPKRWGKNKPDDSGVHRSIRVRLETARKDGVRSIYHLALIIIDQCSRVFFDRTKSRDNRPEMLDLFGSAIGNMTEFTCISYQHFWRHINTIAFRSLAEATAEKWQRFLDINPEGKLLQESQDISEELMILLRVYGQQITVVKEFRRHLATLREEEMRTRWREAEKARASSQQEGASTVPDAAMIELAVIQKLDRLLSWHLDTAMSPSCDDDATAIAAGRVGGTAATPSAVPTQEADVLVELIESRRLELQELEETASRTCNQLEGLLSLKQQQASILEAKAAKIRADESIKQGRSIIAFTIVTIFFLPLGFLAAFFGMNNSMSTNNSWMTLSDQVSYMFGISAAVVFIAVSLAFSQTARTALSISLLPLALFAEYTRLGPFWRAHDPLHRLDKIGDHLRRRIAEYQPQCPENESMSAPVGDEKTRSDSLNGFSKTRDPEESTPKAVRTANKPHSLAELAFRVRRFRQPSQSDQLSV